MKNVELMPIQSAINKERTFLPALTISIYETNHTVKFLGKNNSVLLETNLKTDSEETVKRLNRKSHDKRHSLREI